MPPLRFNLITLVALLCVCLVACNSDTPPKPARVTLSQGKRALASGKFERATEIAKQLLEQNPDSIPSLMLAAEAATKLENYQQAIDLYERIPESKTSDAAVSRWAIGEIYFHLGEASQSLKYLRKALELNPNLTYAHTRLSTSLDNLGLRWDSQKHLLALLKSGEVSFPNLLFLGNIRKETFADEEVARYLSANPKDLLPNVAKASHLRTQGKLPEAKQLLEALIEQSPQLVEAHIQLGRVLLQQGALDDESRFEEWNASLPTQAELHPDAWYLRGRSQQNPRLAVEYYARAIEIDPNHLPALQSLSQAASQASLPEIAELAGVRAAQVQKLNLKLQQLYQNRDNIDYIREAAELTFGLSRYWEAFAWCMIGRDLAANDSQSPKWINDLVPLISSKKLSNSTPQTVASNSPLLVALSKRPASTFASDVQSISQQTTEPGKLPPSITPTLSDVKLVDITDSLQIDFTYSNGQSNRDLGRLMQQFTGGGVGTADLNRDGWCDLYLVQGESNDDSENLSDQIFLNIDGNKLLNATRELRIDAKLFGQGVAIGDLNGDGFDDIFLGTTTENQLWLNQGDGTFLEHAALLTNGNQPSPSWTTSVLIGDINGDGLADVYEANYVQGDGVFTQRCQVEGKSSVCSPLAFEPAMDHVYFATKQGTFILCEESADLLGNSLGACLFRMSSELLPHVFVAVDQQANLLLKSAERGATTAPENEALLRGVAYDEDGNAQACMGIAVNDIDGDGQVDIHVTNFYDEYNTLYLQKNGVFVDRTAARGLVGETLPMLGFGVQACDLQRDGLADFIVLNGHIDDQTHTGAPEKMPAQVFIQTSSGFKATSAGAFFDTPRLGRSLAKWDYDSDGLDDFVATDLESSTTILRNESSAQYSLIRLRFVGTRSERSALTTIATLTGEDSQGNKIKTRKQLVGGGGYLASNELYVDFAVPKSLAEISIAVDWPAGTTESHAGILVDREYLLVEESGLHELRTFSADETASVNR